MVMVPNPSGGNGWPVHRDGGIHCVRPFNFGPWLAVVRAFAKLLVRVTGCRCSIGDYFRVLPGYEETDPNGSRTHFEVFAALRNSAINMREAAR